MKKIFTMLLIVNCSWLAVFSQNVGIGTNEPVNKLQVQGNLVVTAPTTATTTAPTAAQTKTMVNASTITFLNTDSTGRIYDPGGPAANYLPNLLAYASFFPLGGVPGIEVTVETMDLATGDSLIIKESSTGPILLAVGNGYSTTGKWVFNGFQLYIIFKSNADANTGAGFSLLFRSLYDNSSSLPDVSGFTTKALIFNTKNGAFRSGYLNNSVQGDYSTAMGVATTASGDYSTAMGRITTASGESSTAMGYNTTASGRSSTAMGLSTTASGDYSTAIGSYVSTNNHEGSFIIGDNSALSVLNSATANNLREFTCYRFSCNCN